jgi:prevent-host-death family protein
MITVGIKTLKNKISEYLRLVEKGERIVITKHHKVVAEIVPPLLKVSDSACERKMNELAAEGKIIRAKRKESRIDELLASDKTATPDDWQSIYEEVRSDRF